MPRGRLFAWINNHMQNIYASSCLFALKYSICVNKPTFTPSPQVNCFTQSLGRGTSPQCEQNSHSNFFSAMGPLKMFVFLIPVGA